MHRKLLNLISKDKLSPCAVFYAQIKQFHFIAQIRIIFILYVRMRLQLHNNNSYVTASHLTHI